MKLAVLILGAVLATALAQDGQKPNPMGEILKNMDMGAMTDMLKDVDINSLMKNIDPSTISGLMQNMDMGSMSDIMKNMDMGAMSDIMKNVDMGAMSDIMKNVDIGGMMKNMDMGAMGDIVKNVDIGSMMKKMDMGAMGDIVKNVDIGSVMKNMDMGAMSDIMKNVDVGSMMKNMDLGSMGGMLGGVMKNMDLGSMGNILKNVDVSGMMKNMDMGSISGIMQNMDLGAITGMMKDMDMGGAMAEIMQGMQNVDIGSVMKDMDIGSMAGMMKNMDMGAMGDIMKNMDIGAISGMMKNMDMGAMMNMAKDLDISSLLKGKLPSMDAIKSIFGIPADATLDDIRIIIAEKLNAAGVPLDSPKKLLEFVQEKVKGLPLPEDLDPTAMLNMIHGQLEAMGIPEDPTKLQEFMFEKAGLGDIKNIDELKDPEILAKIIQKKAFAILGLDENEDPNEVKERIHKQLLDEAKKLGASLPDDYTKEDVMKAMDRLLTKNINELLGTDAKSVVPEELHTAVLGKLTNMGFPIGNLGSIKKHVIDMAMKHLMKSAIPMVMNFFMPRPQMPQRPPMMPPMMPPTVPLNLDIEVNVEQPPMQMMPRYLNGIEQSLHHPDLDQFDEASVYHHIMAVRQALRYGEMPEEVLQEMVEDLMNARLKARVLSVRNMFLSDRIEAMERDMERMTEVPEFVPMREDPIRRMMRPRGSRGQRPRVL